MTGFYILLAAREAMYCCGQTAGVLEHQGETAPDSSDEKNE